MIALSIKPASVARPFTADINSVACAAEIPPMEFASSRALSTNFRISVISSEELGAEAKVPIAFIVAEVVPSVGYSMLETHLSRVSANVSS